MFSFRIEDNFPRNLFSRIEYSKGFFQTFLPEDLISLLDLNTIQLTDFRVEKHNPQEEAVDFLYQLKAKPIDQTVVNGIAEVYLLFDYRRVLDISLYYQLLNIYSSIYENQLAQYNELKPVYTIVFLPAVLSGISEKEFNDYFKETPGFQFDCLRKYIPEIRVQLVHLQNLSHDYILSSKMHTDLKSFLSTQRRLHSLEFSKRVLDFLQEENELDMKEKLIYIIKESILIGAGFHKNSLIMAILRATTFSDRELEIFIKESKNYFDEDKENS